LIDLHFHCLPNIDDGPRSWQESIALCKEAEKQGTTTIVATPHVLRDPWLNEHAIDRDELIIKLNDFLGGTPKVLPGCEYYFSADAVELWEQGSRGPLTGLNRSKYLLMEFPATTIPLQAESVVHELSLLDVIPVIAHPERNLVFAENPDKLERLIQLGAIAQVTAGSITGSFGKQAQSATEEFFKRGLIHLVASDAHSPTRRPPQLAEAREKVRTTWGQDPETLFFETIPTAIINNEKLEI
jgi:protein-tyrosine phosphatase